MKRSSRCTAMLISMCIAVQNYTYPHPLRGGEAPPPTAPVAAGNATPDEAVLGTQSRGQPRLPEGSGLAAAYPGDAGIAAHPDVLFTDNFEGYSGGRISWSEIGGWGNVYGTLAITRETAHVHNGKQAIRISCTGNSQQSHGMVKQLAPQRTLFVRYYMKFHSEFPGCHHVGLSIRGGREADLFANPTGNVPNGSDFFWVSLDHLSPLHSWNPDENTTSPGWLYNYCYHMDQDVGWGDVLLSTGPLNGSKKLGSDFVPRTNVTPERNRWTCFELMVQCNTPGSRDGRVGIWMDGKLVIDHGNLRFRSVQEIASRFVNLGVYASEVRPNQTVWYDDLVCATRYIGPLGVAGNQPPALEGSAGRRE